MLLYVAVQLGITVQVDLVIRGRYVPLIWTANIEFADKKTHFDYKFGTLVQFYISEYANS